MTIEYKERLLTVAEWIEILAEYPADHIVIMSKDGEGNGFSPLANSGHGLYEAETTYSGTVYNLDEREPSEAVVPCVVLWPTN